MDDNAARKQFQRKFRANIRSLLILALFLSSTIVSIQLESLGSVYAQDAASITPGRQWGIFFDTSGDLQIAVNETGIAVRVELPREFTVGVVGGDNDTAFVESDINNDYYYYAVWDEANQYAYKPEAPCFRPDFSQYDVNAPICVEIWSTFNNTFVNFTAPRFIRFHNLRAPVRAGLYNVTLTIAKTANLLGYPDFLNGVRRILVVPVSERESPSQIRGYIRDAETLEIIMAKGVVYALDVNQNNLVVARAFVNSTTGFFNLTGLYAGSYILQASAGAFTRSDGDLLAYSLTQYPFPVSIGSGQVVGVDLYLDRGPQIFGTIIYRNSTAFPFQIRPITDNAWFQIVGVTVLNYTVEARDSQGYIYRNSSISKNVTEGDTYRLIIGNGTKFVGYPSYGTEFAGLPRTNIAGQAETYVVNAWIYGYLQEGTTPSVVTIDGRFQEEQRVDIRMIIGGLIGGRIRFFNPQTQFPESPSQAELTLLQTATNKIFGGNVLIQVIDESGRLRGVTVYNATLPDGTVTYATEVSIPFFVLGFSEFYNRTFSGIWRSKDYGIGTPGATGETYRIRVYIRGYVEVQEVNVFLPTGRMYNATYDMYRGALIRVGVFSYNARPGTRVLQSLQQWILFGAAIPPRARIYFFDSNGVSLGYVEKILAPGDPDVTTNSLDIKFVGMNWPIRDIIYFGAIPTAIREDTISIKAYTVGYVQQMPITVFAQFGSAQTVFMGLLIANRLNALVPLFADESLFTSLTEFEFSRLEVYDTNNELRGVDFHNFTVGTDLLNFTVLGFGGLSHFFYVDPDGSRFFDYGIDVGDYTAVFPDFGFTWRRVFTKFTDPPAISFPQLQYFVGIVFRAIRLGLVFPGFGVVVRGFNSTGNFGNELVELSWVLVEAENTLARSTTTLDGNYTLHLPAGVYTLRFSLPGYVTKEYVNIVIVDWSDIIPWDPSPLEQSGAPFPTLAATAGFQLEAQPLPPDAAGGWAYMFRASIDEAQTELVFRWTVSQGVLNSTEGKAVMWRPSEGLGDEVTVTVQAYRNEALVGEKSMQIAFEPVPEFPASPWVALVAAMVLFVVGWKRVGLSGKCSSYVARQRVA